MANSFGKLTNIIRKGCRKHEVLTLFWQECEYLTNIANEAHVEHAIGLVENQNIDFVEMHGALLMKIKQAARCGHKNIEALAQHSFLRINVYAAEHNARAQILIRAIGFDAVLYLRGEFAGRRKHKRTHCVWLFVGLAAEQL